MSEIISQDRTSAFGRTRPSSHFGGTLETAGFAHELGNLIQIASSAMNIVARDAHVRSRIGLIPAISGARKSLDRAGALVRQTMHRMDQPSADIGKVDVATCLLEIEAQIQHTWPPETRVTVEAGADLPPANCDPLGLYSAILNLALNSRDAMPNGGSIAITCEPISGDSEPMLQVSVRDTGIGMSPNTLAQAFDPFFTTKSEGLGGLGLPMVRRFAEESGGRVTIESQPGIGTTVVLQLRVWRDPTP